jgi:hypothetical protein
MNNQPKFEVAAGKLEVTSEEGRSFEKFERNYKYINVFETIEEAEAAVKSCQGYDFIDLLYVTASGTRYLMEPQSTD